MLDFYTIHDIESSACHSPTPDKYVGGINNTEFEYWQDRDVLPKDLDFFSDFRLTREEVVIWLDKMSAIGQVMTKENQLITILTRASEQNTGLMAYCD